MTATAQRPSDEFGPIVSQSVAAVFAGFGLIASLGMGWMLARSSAGLPPFQLPGRAATTTAANAEAQTVHIIASDVKFDQKTLQVAGPGDVAVQFDNKGLIDHDFTVEGAKFTVTASPGKSSQKTLKLDKPGTYVFYCSIPGHREAGMQGTLTVGDGKATLTSAKSTDMAAMDAMAGMSHTSHADTVPAEQHGLQQMTPVVDGDTKVFNLTADVVQWEIVKGVKQEAWTYNRQLPGPMIRVTEGDNMRITLKNNLPEPTVIHFHGPQTPNSQDGVPDVTQKAIMPGETYTYEFVARPAGTYTFHTHHNTAVQEPKGLYGVLIIDPRPGSAEAKRDAEFQHDYTQVISEFGGYYLINGHSFPETDVLTAKVGEKIRIRLINVGQMAHPMHLHGFHFKVIGMDGIPVEGPPMIKDTINIAPGERYDLEIDADNPGTWVFHCHILAHVANAGVEPGGMITVLKVDPA